MSLFPISDHCDGVQFFNPTGPGPRPFSDLLKWRRERAQGSAVAWPKSVPPGAPVQLPATLAADQIAATFIGHSSWLLQFSTLNLLLDPVFATRAGPFGLLGPKRVCPPALRLGELPRIDVVLISHNHYDHLDLTALRWLARQRRPQFVAPLGLKPWLEARGVSPVVQLDWWESHWAKDGTEIIGTPAQHWSSRTPWDRCRTLWSGFWLRTRCGDVFFAGDTGWSTHFDRIRARLGSPALALLPIGAYEPRWFMAPQHQNPQEAVQGMKLCNAAHAAGCHWGTLHLTDEPVEEPARKLAEALEAEGLPPERFRAMRPGEVWDVPPI